MRLTTLLLSQHVLFVCECRVNFLHFEMLYSAFALISFPWVSFSILFKSRSFLIIRYLAAQMHSVPIVLVGVGRERERRQLKLSEVCEPVVVRVIAWGSFYCVTVVHYGMFRQCCFCLQLTETQFLSCFWREELSVNKKKSEWLNNHLALKRCTMACSCYVRCSTSRLTKPTSGSCKDRPRI